MLYLLGSGILAAATLPAAVAEAKTKKRTPTTRRSNIMTGDSDPWSLFPGSVHATRTATEVVLESTGMPEHLMMIGITNWQQQVPLPQAYTGANAWHIPLHGSDQVDPQPTTPPIRPAGTALRGASITSFAVTGTDAYSLQYRLAGQLYRIDYALQGSAYRFTFTDPTGTATTEVYQRR